jgi:hypothetical protein
MSKKLYKVKVTLYVMAENESEARLAATNAKFDIFECTARKADDVDAGWENAIPYNANDDRTCAEILASQLSIKPDGSAMPLPHKLRPRKWIVTNSSYMK